MSKKWDSVGSPQIFQAWCEKWGKEALRVLCPGGYALVMGGTRTFHRLACGLEDAGFEIRDTISYWYSGELYRKPPMLAWIYGQGFPKSHNLSKGYDRRAFKSWLDTLDHGLTRAEVRKAVSQAVNGGLSDTLMELREDLTEAEKSYVTSRMEALTF